MATLTPSPAMVTCKILHKLNKGIFTSLTCFNSCIWSECLAKSWRQLLSDQPTLRASSTSLPLLSLRCNLLLNMLSFHSQRYWLYKHKDNNGQLAHHLILTISPSKKGREDRKKTRRNIFKICICSGVLQSPLQGWTVIPQPIRFFGVVIRSHIYWALAGAWNLSSRHPNLALENTLAVVLHAQSSYTLWLPQTSPSTQIIRI